METEIPPVPCRSCRLLGMRRFCAVSAPSGRPPPAGASVARCCETGAAPREPPTPRELCQQLESVFVPGYY